MDIGIVGLGLVGNAISGRLVAAGHEVHGYDIRPEACAAAAALGVRTAPDAATVARNTGLVFLCLMTSEDRRALLWGTQALAQALRPGSTLLDVSTSRPGDIIADAQRMLERQVRLVDVCLSGSSEVIARGEALALVGDVEADALYEHALSPFTKACYFLGGPGEGNRMKLIVNMVFGLNRLVLAEALGLARSAGYDLDSVLEILRTGETYSKCMDSKGPRMIGGAYMPPVAKLAQHAKDVSLIREIARELNAFTPVTDLHGGLLDRLVEDGFGEFDNAAIFKAFDAKGNPS